MYLLDTVVLSEIRKPAHVGDPNVRAWVDQRHADDFFLSVITMMEVAVGITRLRRRDHTQADRLQSWLDVDVLGAFSERILPVDLEVAQRTAALHVPDPRPPHDALIAGTALVHGLTVVTRNVADFEPTGVNVINPWDA